jgi:hypothetical protein
MQGLAVAAGTRLARVYYYEAFPNIKESPLFHGALADDVMIYPLKHAAQALGYA